MQVPNIISTKDLAYFEDIFNWNFTLCKKLYDYKNNVKDEDIKDYFSDVYNNHKEILDNIINILKEGEQNNEQ